MCDIELIRASLARCEYSFIPATKRLPDHFWFESQNHGGVHSYLHFVSKPRIKLFTVHVGWTHNEAHALERQLLRQNWSAGYAWLDRVHVLSAPCMLTFNLADHLKWRAGGISFKTEEQLQGSIDALIASDALAKLKLIKEPSELLAMYLGDERPFNWRSSNAALRSFAIASLTQLLGINKDSVQARVQGFLPLIQSDMFELGDSEKIIANLFA